MQDNVAKLIQMQHGIMGFCDALGSRWDLRVDLQVNDLLEFIADSFEPPELNDPTVRVEIVEQVKRLLTAACDPMGAASLAHLDTLTDEIVQILAPIAVVRSLTWHHGVRYDASRLSGWREFTDRYGDFIMAVHEDR